MTDLITAEQAAAELAAHADGLAFAVTAANSLQVTSAADVEIAAELLGQLKQALDAVEKRRKELSLPLTRVARQINEAAKQQTAPLAQADLALRTKIRAFHERDAEQRQAQLAAAQASSGQRVVDPGLLPAEQERSVATSTGSVSMRSRWTFEVTDLLALVRAAAKHPDEYLQFLTFAPSEIGAFVRAGGRELPGVRIHETSDPVVKGVAA
jgi:hypothetical protein